MKRLIKMIILVNNSRFIQLRVFLVVVISVVIFNVFVVTSLIATHHIDSVNILIKLEFSLSLFDSFFCCR